MTLQEWLNENFDNLSLVAAGLLAVVAHFLRAWLNKNLARQRTAAEEGYIDRTRLGTPLPAIPASVPRRPYAPAMVSAGVVAAILLSGAGGYGLRGLVEGTVLPVEEGIGGGGEMIPTGCWVGTLPPVCVFTATPTATRTPSPTRTATQEPTRASTATPADPTPTPVRVTPIIEVTPIGGEPILYPRQVKAEVYYRLTQDYEWLYIRSTPEKPATIDNRVGTVTDDKLYFIYLLYKYADGSVWACMDDVTDWKACRRWIAEKADLNPVDGVLEEYSEPVGGSDG